MAESGSPSAPRPAVPPASPGVTAVAVLSAWLVPGLGHVYLKRPLRGIAFFVLVVVAVIVGSRLQGNLYQPVQGQPLTLLATAASMGMGFIYFLLRFALHYQGDLAGAGYEYGTAFLLTAGLMNLLLVLDAWDIVRGKKE
ncbi:MAG TPA: DUF6677 family protein [Thermoanaerobaculia bacterium]